MNTNESTKSLLDAFKQAEKDGCPITIEKKSVLVPIDLRFSVRRSRKGKKIFIVKWDASGVRHRCPSYWYDTTL